MPDYNIDETSLKAKAEWIKECEKSFIEQFYPITDEICNKRKLKIVRLYGPTCSGKTTAANAIITLFENCGKRAHIVSIDDFFYDRDILLEMSRAKGFETVDYDSPDTIDMKELCGFVKQIFEEDKAVCPTFNFKLGCRDGYKTFNIDDNDIFIFEGIQACYADVKTVLSEHGAASIFIAPLKSISIGGEIFTPDSIRLMRRLVRDFKFRGSSPKFTFEIWKNVRENEVKNIFPYADESDYKVNSTMQYEIGILKPYLDEILGTIGTGNKYFAEAEAILNSVKNVESIPSELILDGYLYREFV